MKHKIDFKHMSWEIIGVGAQQKKYETQNKIIRILRLNDKFEEENWCTNGHIGFVLEGEFALKFLDKKVHYEKGSAFQIMKGEKEKHKAIIGEGDFVEILLIEYKM